MAADPRACTMRAAMSVGAFGASPHTSDAAVNTAAPATNIRP